MSSQTLLFAELAPDPQLNFPEPLSERYRPQRIADFAGLGEVKKVLAGFVARPMNAGFLFLGPAGTGVELEVSRTPRERPLLSPPTAIVPVPFPAHMVRLEPVELFLCLR
jgi:hypothetical protein